MSCQAAHVKGLSDTLCRVYMIDAAIADKADVSATFPVMESALSSQIPERISPHAQEVCPSVRPEVLWELTHLSDDDWIDTMSRSLE